MLLPWWASISSSTIHISRWTKHWSTEPIASGVRIDIRKIDSEGLTSPEKTQEALDGVHGILIPGGFGERGIPGMIDAARVAREQGIPYLGICLGMQIQVIEWARNVCGILDANSSEFTPDGPSNVIALLEEQVDVTQYGGTMRLGLSESVALEGTRIHKAYGTVSIMERHRHRYEVKQRFSGTTAAIRSGVFGVHPRRAIGGIH